MIESVYFWTATVCLGIGTYIIRGLFIFLSSKIKISERIKEILSFIPAAILPAMIAPMVFYHQGQVEALMHKERLVILILAVVFCYFVRNMLLTLGFGLGLLFIFTQI